MENPTLQEFRTAYDNAMSEEFDESERSESVRGERAPLLRRTFFNDTAFKMRGATMLILILLFVIMIMFFVILMYNSYQSGKKSISGSDKA